MKDLLRFFIRHHFVITFIILEAIALTILIDNNDYQKAKFVGFTHAITGNFAKRISSAKDYASLRQENRQLIDENNRLYNLLKSSYRIQTIEKLLQNDTTTNRQYVYLSAKVINNSTNKQYNYITLNKGKKDGLEKDMAVVCNEGIVGVVKEVSGNFSSVISLLNRNLQISAKIKSSGYFGPLEWTGKGYRKAILKDILYYVVITKGDTVITSGYSAMFPEGYMIGIISDFKLKGGNYYEVSVDLSTDFRSLKNVQVIKNNFRQEQLKLEKSSSE